MLKSILFLAPFPNENNIKDGMISRVKAIDVFFDGDVRTYLHVSLSKFKKSNYRVAGNARIYEMNILRHFFAIYKIISSSQIIYSHSIYMSLFIWPFLFFFKKHFILDVHGVVPEEEYFYGNRRKSYYYSFVERMTILRSDYIICVTDAMKNHLINKYKSIKGEFIIYSIIPQNIRISFNDFLVSNSQLNNKVNIIYSGGISQWQNIDLMLNIIEKNQSSNIRYTILTGDKKAIKELLPKFKIDPGNIEINSVSPSDLAGYYRNADYAFILRDDNVVNNVANPTKLIEYLYYGIVPIVLSSKIGDFFELGYEYLPIEKFSTSVEKLNGKSLKNISIAKKLIERNDNLNIRNIVLCNF